MSDYDVIRIMAAILNAADIVRDGWQEQQPVKVYFDKANALYNSGSTNEMKDNDVF